MILLQGDCRRRRRMHTSLAALRLADKPRRRKMIQFYYWPTPNGHKITMFLEEAGLEYAIHPVDISAGDQFRPDFLAISPNNRMPAIIDTTPSDGGEPISVFESGAILLCLADKTGRFLPKDVRGRNTATEWLFWQVGGLGPMADRTPISDSTRRAKSLTRSTATSRRQTVSTACSIDISKTARSSPVTGTASPTWLPIPGSFLGSGSSRIWTNSRTCGAGSTLCASVPGRSGRMPEANRTRTAPPSRKKERRSCSDRRRPERP